MPYSGETNDLLFLGGGLVHATNKDLIPPNAMMPGSKNINTHTGGRQKRGGSAHRYAAQMPSASQVMGIYNYKLKNDTSFLIVGTADGKIYKNDTTTIKTGLTVDKFFSFETFNNLVYICNTADRVQTWDGVAGATSNLANPATDWGTTSPRQIIKHGRGNSERLWAIGVPGFEQNIYISADGGDNFVTGVTVLAIDTGDSLGIVGGVVYGNRLILFSRSRSYIVDDASLTVSEWGYEGSQWFGGTTSWRTLVRTENDVYSLTPDGDIYSFTAVQQYGDYKAASVARPAFLDKWIRDNMDITKIPTQAHGVYDPKLRAIKWFMVRSGQTQIDTALVQFLDKNPVEAWSVHDNIVYESGYSASVSAIGPDSGGKSQVLTGGYTGWLWTLETSGLSDNANGYDARVMTPDMDFGDARLWKKYDELHMITNPDGYYVANVKVYIDGIQYGGTAVLNFGGVGNTYGTARFTTTATYGGTSTMYRSVGIRKHGVRIRYEIFNITAGEDLFISRCLTDFVPKGKKPNMG